MGRRSKTSYDYKTANLWSQYLLPCSGTVSHWWLPMDTALIKRITKFGFYLEWNMWTIKSPLFSLVGKPSPAKKFFGYHTSSKVQTHLGTYFKREEEKNTPTQKNNCDHMSEQLFLKDFWWRDLSSILNNTRSLYQFLQMDFNFYDGGYITGIFENNITYQINSLNASTLFIGLRKLTSSKGISSIDKYCNFHRGFFPKEIEVFHF